MLQLMRKHHKIAMLVVAIIVIISFAFFGPGSGEHPGHGYFKKIGGKVYLQADLDAAGAEMQMVQQTFMNGGFSDPPAKLMGLMQAAQGIERRARGGMEAESVLVNLITLREEAKRLGVTVEDKDLQKAVESLKSFQTEGKFDRPKLDAMLESGRDPAATKRYFFTMLKDALLLDKIQKLVGGPMQATDYAVNQDYNSEHVKTTIQTVLVPRKPHEEIKATDEDVQKYYDANKEKKVFELEPIMRSEASRDLKYIKIEKSKKEDISKLPADQQEARKKEWTEIDKKAPMTATVISNAMADETKPLPLEEAAALVKDKPEYLPVEIKTAVGVTASTLPDDLKSEAAVAEAIQAEDKGVPQSSNGWVIFEASNKKDPRLLTLEEAKPKLVEKLTKEKIAAALQDAANGVRSKLQESIAAGKPFAEALTAAGVTSSTWTYSSTKPAKDAPPYLSAAQQAVTSLDANALAANPIPAGDDMLVVYLEKRELPNDPKMEDDKKLLKRTRGLNDSPFSPSPIFLAWFNQRREALAPVFEQQAP